MRETLLLVFSHCPGFHFENQWQSDHRDFVTNLFLQVAFVGAGEEIGVIDKQQILRTGDKTGSVVTFLRAVE